LNDRNKARSELTFSDQEVSADVVITQTTDGEYFHAMLMEDDVDGFRLKHMPYRPCPYPDQDISLDSYLVHHGEKKVWAISQCGNFAFISNDQTDNKLVCCQLNNSKTTAHRVVEKLAKGYKEDGACRVFNAKKRRLA
jgi:hypothetical protein